VGLRIHRIPGEEDKKITGIVKKRKKGTKRGTFFGNQGPSLKIKNYFWKIII
jgi:hypothetical protein